MQTIKIKYNVPNADDTKIIKEYRKQYSSMLHSAYNRAIENQTEKQITSYLDSLENFSLLDSYFTRCAVKESIQLAKANKGNKLIFGGKKNFISRCQGKISREEYLDKRLSPLYCMGEANQKANRKFKLTLDAQTIVFQPCKKTHITLEIHGSYRNYQRILKRLYVLQETKEAPITYKLDDEYIYVSFDEKKVASYDIDTKRINNRVFAIDLNPNYVGWSVTDWKSGGDFKVVDSGVVSIKQINDIDFSLKGKHLSTGSKERKHIANKRKHEVYEICKNLVGMALHYRCQMFVMEELSIESSDKGKGDRFNRLCNNMWNRDKMAGNIKKRCNICGIEMLEVKAAYSSFVGNFLYRDLCKPDMVLASIEIGRRGYEFHGQYVAKEREIKGNIIVPDVDDFADRYAKSMEEFGVEGDIRDLREVYYLLKKTGCRYRLSLEETTSGFSRLFSKASLLLRTC